MVNLDSTQFHRYTKPKASEFNTCSTIKCSKPTSGTKHKNHNHLVDNFVDYYPTGKKLYDISPKYTRIIS